MILRVRARSLAPLALCLRRATGNDLNTQTYISGSALRGALAYAWLEENGMPAAPGAAFRRLFQNVSVRFGNLVVGRAMPAPLSGRQCSGDAESHPLVDHLLQAGANSKPGEDCAQCRAKRARIPGYVEHIDRAGFRRREVYTRRTAHTAIDARLLRVANQQFHTATVLEEEQYFSGLIYAPEEEGGQLWDLMKRTPELWVGRGRTRGQGRLQMEAGNERHPPVISAEEIEAFTQVAWRWPAMQNKLVFSCTFHSPGIVLDEWLMTKPALEATDIDPQLGGFERIASYQASMVVSGWNSAAGLPKADWQAIAPGSAYLFARAGGHEAADFVELAAILNTVLARGVGERTVEGFGEVSFCHRFHTDLAEAV